MACSPCRSALEYRRYGAFVADVFLLIVIGSLLAFLHHRLIGGALPDWFPLSLLVLFFFKDGFRGLSPGKWLFDLRVLDEHTLRPAGFGASFKRNLVLLLNWIAILIVVASIHHGRRWGDRWAGTVVIWRRYADRMPRERAITLCRHCRYDLTGKVSGICPECSTPIPKHDQEAIAAKGLSSAASSRS